MPLVRSMLAAFACLAIALPAQSPGSKPTPDAPEVRPAKPSEPASPKGPNIDPQLPPAILKALKRVSANYEAWGWVDDEARRAPFLCRLPLAPSARLSEAKVGTPHAKKLYGLYAVAPLNYAPELGTIFVGGLPHGEPKRLEGFGQIVVKESCLVKKVTTAAYEKIQEERSAKRRAGQRVERVLRPIHEGETVVMPGKPGPLFVMLQAPRGTPGTDEGWVYATFDRTKTGFELSAAGNIQSCRACHVRAKHDRLFGIEGGGAPKALEGWQKPGSSDK